MRRLFVFLWCSIVSAHVGLAAEKEWKPGTAPLMTRWAKDVSPKNSHPEYPRPQMVREDWLNLNGLWQFELGKADDAPPLGKDLSKRILERFSLRCSGCHG